MRSTWWLVLPVLFVLAGPRVSVSVSLASGRGKSARAEKATAVADPAPTHVTKVRHGETAEDAQELAFEDARDKVKELLRQELGQPDWEPPARLLEKSTLASHGVAVLDPSLQPTKEDKVFSARYKVTLTKEYRREVEKAARHERVQDRHLVLVRVLAGLVAVCLVVTGYLRLDEWTRGYATKLLRLSAAVLLLAAVAGLLLTL